MLAILCGGVGAARLLAGLQAATDPASITAIVNVADDVVVHGLYVAPDLDTVTYTLAGQHNADAGWGLVGETWRVMDELDGLGGSTWFRLGDRDLATHLMRTGRLADGATLSQVTAELATARGVSVQIVPASDDRVATKLTTVAGERLDFQEYFVQRRHDVAIASVEFEGAASAAPAPGVLESLRDAERVVIAPSNPIVSIDPILAIPGIRAALAARRDAIAVSPLVAGAALKGPADRLMTELGAEASVAGIARHYAGLISTLVIDVADADSVASVEACGVTCVVTETVMSTPARARSLAEVVLGG